MAKHSLAQLEFAFEISLQQAVDSALANSHILKNELLNVESAFLQKNRSFDPGPFELSYQRGNINSANVDYYWTINQNFGSIPLYIATLQKSRLQYRHQLTAYQISLKQLTAEVKSAYLFCQYQQSMVELKERELLLYKQMGGILDNKFTTDSISPLEWAMISARFSELNTSYLNARDDLEIALLKFRSLLMTDLPLKPRHHEPELYEIVKSPDTLERGHLIYTFYDMNHQVAKSEEQIAFAQYFPEVCAGYFYQQIDGVKGFDGWQVGISVPLWIPARQATVKQAKLASEMTLSEYYYQQNKVETEIEVLLFELNKCFRNVRLYSDEALPAASLYYEAAASEMVSEEPDFNRFVELVSKAVEAEEKYLSSLNEYNQTAIQLEIFE